MKKHVKIYFTLIFTFIFFFSFISNSINALSDLNIVQDSENSNSLPENFRKTSDISKITSIKKLNKEGLNSLNISGSAQFGKDNLTCLINSISNNFSIVDIDLREESHGFVNGIPISFLNTHNNANKGLNLNEVIEKENSDLSTIKLNTPLTLTNTNKTIIPKVVENELDLVKSKNITYIRIPVTDGDLPNDTMVSYFVNFVNNQPQNTWLHFHCKAGIGRTTTFMIMYDIMKNCNEVSLNDIIARQLLLSDISKNDSINFYIGKHNKFLNDFYTKCKNKEFTTSSLNFSPIRCSTSLDKDTSYIKGSIVPKFLYVISENDMIKAEQTMIATLQGLIASKSDNQIYILSSSEPDYKIWLLDLKKNHSTKYKTIKDPWFLLKKFEKYIDGYTLYSNVK